MAIGTSQNIYLDATTLPAKLIFMGFQSRLLIAIVIPGFTMNFQ